MERVEAPVVGTLFSSSSSCACRPLKFVSRLPQPSGLCRRGTKLTAVEAFGCCSRHQFLVSFCPIAIAANDNQTAMAFFVAGSARQRLLPLRMGRDIWNHLFRLANFPVAHASINRVGDEQGLLIGSEINVFELTTVVNTAIDKKQRRAQPLTMVQVGHYSLIKGNRWSAS